MNRCKYCGSTAIHPETQQSGFSAGKAVAGAIVFGPVGSVAGLAGKKRQGYRCSACGAFMDQPMDSGTQFSVDVAIQDAEAGRSRSMYDYFKKQYVNIQANISAPKGQPAGGSAAPAAGRAPVRPAEAEGSAVKRVSRTATWQPDCPIHVVSTAILSTGGEDVLRIEGYNQGKTALRSVYLQVTVFDDTGDQVSQVSCVYQGLRLNPGEALPEDREFSLKTDLAYRVEILCEKVALEDDSVWRGDAGGASIPLAEQPSLTPETFPRLKYARARLEKVCRMAKNRPLYLPMEGEGCWQCVCGSPALPGEPCHRCGAAWEAVKAAVSQQNLMEDQQKAVRERATRRAKATVALYENVIQEKQAGRYDRAKRLMGTAKGADLVRAVTLFDELGDYRDAKKLAEECRRKREELYTAARAAMDAAKTPMDWTSAEEQFQALGEYKDCKELVKTCQEATKKLRAERQAEEKARAEAARRKKIKLGIIAGAAAATVIALVLLITKVIVPAVNRSNAYKEAQQLLAQGDYVEAVFAFRALGDYKDATEQADYAQAEADYAQAEAYYAQERYAEAITAFRYLGDFKDAPARLKAAQEEYKGIYGFIQIAAGESHTVGVRGAGTMVATGSNGSGRCDVSTWTDIVAVAAGNDHTVGLKSNGTVVATGSNDSGRCDVSQWSDIVAVAAGGFHTVGAKSDGTVVAAGLNDYGQCDVSTWTDIVAVAAGNSHTVGLKSDGTVVAAGMNHYGQCDVSTWTDIVAVSAGGSHTVGLKSDGTVVATGSNYSGQCDVSQWSDIVAVAAGGSHTVGLKSDGSVVATGANRSGQCDVSDWFDLSLLS